MNLQFYIDMIIFSTTYSQMPFFLLDTLEKTGDVFTFESSARKQIRHLVVLFVAPFFFAWYSKSGWRNRYILWHLERNRRNSGLNALELFAVPLYFCIYVIPFEFLISYLDHTYPMPIHSSWPLHLLSRFSNTFLAASLCHIVLEYSPFMDQFRLNYFVTDRD
jgi:hypothetical protein